MLPFCSHLSESSPCLLCWGPMSDHRHLQSRGKQKQLISGIPLLFECVFFFISESCIIKLETQISVKPLWLMWGCSVIKQLLMLTCCSNCMCTFGCISSFLPLCDTCLLTCDKCFDSSGERMHTGLYRMLSIWLSLYSQPFYGRWVMQNGNCVSLFIKSIIPWPCMLQNHSFGIWLKIIVFLHCLSSLRSNQNSSLWSTLMGKTGTAEKYNKNIVRYVIKLSVSC